MRKHTIKLKQQQSVYQFADELDSIEGVNVIEVIFTQKRMAIINIEAEDNEQLFYSLMEKVSNYKRDKE